MTVDVTITGKVFNAYGQQITGAQTLETQFGYSLIEAGLATIATAGQYPRPMNTLFDASGGTVVLSANETIDAKTLPNFLGRTIICTTALTITIATGGLSCIVIPPAAGNVTIAVSGNVLVNGAQAALTRALAANPNGFGIQPLATVPLGHLVGGS